MVNKNFFAFFYFELFVKVLGFIVSFFKLLNSELNRFMEGVKEMLEP